MSGDGPVGGGLGPGGQQVPLATILEWHHERGMHAAGPVPNCPSCGPAEYARPLPQPLEETAQQLAVLMDWDVTLAREIITVNARATVRRVLADIEADQAADAKGWRGLPWWLRALALAVSLVGEAAFRAADGLRWLSRRRNRNGRGGP